MKKLIATILVFLVATTCFAHGYWMELKGTHEVGQPVTIRLYFGEYVSGEKLSGQFLDRMKEIKVFAGMAGSEKTAVSMRQLEDYWEGTYVPARAGSYEITGINEEREVQDWTKHNLGIVRPIQYLKSTYVVGNATPTTNASAFLDLSVTPRGSSNYILSAFKESKPYAAVKITITHPDGEETIVETNKDGKADFSLPKAGLYIIDAEWIDKTPGQFKGKEFASTRYKLDYSLYHL